MLAYLQQHDLSLCVLQLLFDGVERAIQTALLRTQTHAALLRLQLLALHLTTHTQTVNSLRSDTVQTDRRRLTLSSVFLSAALSFSSRTACLSASLFSVSSKATALCRLRRRSSADALSVCADCRLRWASVRLSDFSRRACVRPEVNRVHRNVAFTLSLNVKSDLFSNQVSDLFSFTLLFSTQSHEKPLEYTTLNVFFAFHYTAL